MAFLAPLAPLAIEGLTAFIALASAGAAASALGQLPRTSYWDGPTIFSGGSGGGGGGSRPPRSPNPPRRPSPPELPPDPNDAIMAALLADMMAKYLEKGGPTRNGAGGPSVGAPLVGGPLVYKSRVRVDIRLKDKHEWCGHFKKGPPQNIRRAVKDEEPKEDLVHQGAPPQGSKAGLAYAADGAQWIVAWHAPLNGNPKIYVECGDEAPIDWSRIERKLDASCNESNCDGARAAIISDGKNATIFAVFHI